MRINTCYNCGEVITLVYAPFGDHVLCSDCAQVSDLPLTRYALTCYSCGSTITPTDELIMHKGTREMQYWHHKCWQDCYAPVPFPSGQWVRIKWKNDGEEVTVYISFVVHEESSIEDESVFYYMHSENCKVGYDEGDWTIIELVDDPRF